MIDSTLHTHVVAARSAELAARAESAQMMHRAELASRRRERAGRRPAPARHAVRVVVDGALRLLAHARPARQSSA